MMVNNALWNPLPHQGPEDGGKCKTSHFSTEAQGVIVPHLLPTVNIDLL